MKRLLVAYGVDASRLDAQGYGPLRPVASNKTATGRADNRRVEFLITDPKELGPQIAPTEVKAPTSDDQSDRSRPSGKKTKPNVF